MRNSRDDKKVIFLDADASWDTDTAKRLSKLASHCDADILLLSGEQHGPSVESLKAALGADKFDRNISDILFYSEDTPISGIIHRYLEQQADKIAYVIISLTDMEKEFRGYTVYIGKHGLLTDSAARTAARILDFGPFWGDYYREHPRSCPLTHSATISTPVDASIKPFNIISAFHFAGSTYTLCCGWTAWTYRSVISSRFCPNDKFLNTRLANRSSESQSTLNLQIQQRENPFM